MQENKGESKIGGPKGNAPRIAGQSWSVSPGCPPVDVCENGQAVSPLRTLHPL